MTKFSLSSNDSFAQMDISFTNYSVPSDLECFVSKPAVFIFTTFNITNVILLLPLSFFILHSGFQQMRQSNQSASLSSHSDFFIYHLTAIELVGVSGCILNLCGIYGRHNILLTGLHFVSFTSFGVTLFHTLTSIERYLAAVHPVVYMSLKNERGIRIRSISVGCVWMLCIIGAGSLMTPDEFIVLNFFILIVSLTTVCHCTISVLCVLIRPGPGKQGKGQNKVDHVKQRAFYTILAILGSLVIRFAWALVWNTVTSTATNFNCVLITIDFWINLPSSLVLSVLFLHRKIHRNI